MGETMKTLPELFAEVKAKNDSWCDAVGLWRNTSRQQWWVGPDWVSDDLASTIIVGACVAMLEDYWWEKIDDDEFLVTDGMGSLSVAPTLAQALLLAVLAQHERSGT